MLIVFCGSKSRDEDEAINPVQSTLFIFPTMDLNYCPNVSVIRGFNTELKMFKFLYKQCKHKGALHKNTETALDSRKMDLKLQMINKLS